MILLQSQINAKVAPKLSHRSAPQVREIESERFENSELVPRASFSPQIPFAQSQQWRCPGPKWNEHKPVIRRDVEPPAKVKTNRGSLAQARLVRSVSEMHLVKKYDKVDTDSDTGFR